MLSKRCVAAVNERDDETGVTDNGNNRVQLFTSDGTYLKSFGTKGDKRGEFDYAAGMIIRAGIFLWRTVVITVFNCSMSRLSAWTSLLNKEISIHSLILLTVYL